MEELTPLEKVKAALRTIDKQRRLSGRDDLVVVPEYKFYEEGLNDPADVETLLARFQREGIIKVVNYKKLGIELLETVTAGEDEDELAPPVGFRQGTNYVTHHLRVIPEKFDKYFEEQISKPDEDKDKEEFPWNKGCRWINDKTFSCWCGKTLRFQGDDSQRIVSFKMLIDEEGRWVRVRDLVSRLGKSGNDVRVILNQLNERIKNHECGKCFRIVARGSWGEGAYRLKLLHLPEN